MATNIELLQDLHDKLVEKVKNIDETVASIDEEILKLQENEQAAEFALNKLDSLGHHTGYGESNAANWVLQHLSKYVGPHGTYGIRDMITKLEESRDDQSGDRDAYMKLIPVYYALINDEKIPEIAEKIPTYDPDAPCAKEVPDYSFCYRTAIPTTETEGGLGYFTKGDLILVNNRIRVCLTTDRGIHMWDAEGGEKHWAYAGLQDPKHSGGGTFGGGFTLNHRLLAFLSEHESELRDLLTHSH